MKFMPLCLIILFFTISCNRHSNKQIIELALSDFNANKKSFLRLKDTCEKLALENNADDIELEYRGGRDSISAHFRKNNQYHTYFSKQEPKTLIDNSLISGKSFFSHYKKDETLTLPVGFRNLKFQNPVLTYYYNRNEFIGRHNHHLDTIPDLNNAKESDSGSIYFIDSNWAIIIQ